MTLGFAGWGPPADRGSPQGSRLVGSARVKGRMRVRRTVVGCGWAAALFYQTAPAKPARVNCDPAMRRGMLAAAESLPLKRSS